MSDRSLRHVGDNQLSEIQCNGCTAGGGQQEAPAGGSQRSRQRSGLKTTCSLPELHNKPSLSRVLRTQRDDVLHCWFTCETPDETEGVKDACRDSSASFLH
ncbi:unnamed protein product [Pleuronectes platessa]|uniref:Uncharacterized protein n=1 Tax=Pleuronectes platessa TaxID=8262 RepID=A0A9N7Y806_PLEPL|nr:unnamed protein product [Pleuronectes platessa]